MNRLINFGKAKATEKLISYIPYGNVIQPLWEESGLGPAVMQLVSGSTRPQRTHKSAAQRRRRRKNPGSRIPGNRPKSKARGFLHITDSHKSTKTILAKPTRMVRYAQSRRRSRAVRRRGRKARSRYSRRSSRFRSYRKKARRARTRTTLRVYPGGIPKSRKVKLRLTVQTAMKTESGRFTMFKFNPADLSRPLGSMSTSLVANTPYSGVSQGIHVDKDWGTPAVNSITLQASGLDFYWAQYPTAVVLGSKITISFVQDTATTTGKRLIGGFTQLFGENGENHSPELADMYLKVQGDEISMMLNSGLIKNPKYIVSGSSVMKQQQFSFNYSYKKYKKRVKYLGLETGDDWYQIVDTVPQMNPECYFILSDFGLPTTAHFLNCFINIEYTIQFTGGSTQENSTDS